MQCETLLLYALGCSMGELLSGKNPQSLLVHYISQTISSHFCLQLLEMRAAKVSFIGRYREKNKALVELRVRAKLVYKNRNWNGPGGTLIFVLQSPRRGNSWISFLHWGQVAHGRYLLSLETQEQKVVMCSFNLRKRAGSHFPIFFQFISGSRCLISMYFIKEGR